MVRAHADSTRFRRSRCGHGVSFATSNGEKNENCLGQQKHFAGSRGQAYHLKYFDACVSSVACFASGHRTIHKAVANFGRCVQKILPKYRVTYHLRVRTGRWSGTRFLTLGTRGCVCSSHSHKPKLGPPGGATNTEPLHGIPP